MSIIAPTSFVSAGSFAQHSIHPLGHSGYSAVKNVCISVKPGPIDTHTFNRIDINGELKIDKGKLLAYLLSIFPPKPEVVDHIAFERFVKNQDTPLQGLSDNRAIRAVESYTKSMQIAKTISYGALKAPGMDGAQGIGLQVDYTIGEGIVASAGTTTSVCADSIGAAVSTAVAATVGGV